MTPASAPSTQVRNDLDAIGETHGLSLAERDRLIRIVTGAIPGNRDLPLHVLAESIRKLCGSSSDGMIGLFGLLALAAERRTQPHISRLSFALLDFLATMDDYRYFDEIGRAVARFSDGSGEQGLIAARSAFASCMHRYRMEHFPFENRRQQFAAIRHFFSASNSRRESLEDGDAIDFWVEMATSEGWTKYDATLLTLADFVEAFEMRSSGSVVSLDALTEKGFDARVDASLFMGNDEPVLQDSLQRLAMAELKVFKGPALEELARLAIVLPTLRRWRRCGLAALCFAPVQNVFVQLKRQAAPPGQFTKVAACSAVSSYSEKLTELSEIQKVCEDIVSLYRGLRSSADRTGPLSSTVDPEYSIRVGRLMRRKSFADLETSVLQEKAEEVIPSILTVQALVGKVVAQVGAWPASSRDAAFIADRDRFAGTFRRLYCRGED